MSDEINIRITASAWSSLHGHLFPGDGDEHGAVLGASVVNTQDGTRLLVREVWLAQDGVDYVPSERGYRMLTADFVGDRIMDCAESKLAYLAVHCHGGDESVGFSTTDMASHDRGYPALLDLADGLPVGGLVFARHAVAGDIWLADGRRLPVARLEVAGRPINVLRDTPARHPRRGPAYDRQARLFGDRGQDILARQKVGVIGAGGAGSLIVEYLSRLGVGHVVVVDSKRVSPTNVPRVVGSTSWDARSWLRAASRPGWLRRIGEVTAARKVRLARRLARKASRGTRVTAIARSVVENEVAMALVDCDYIFLAADSMQARLIFNSIVHQYLIPGVEVGAKVTVDKESGEIIEVFSVCRPITPDLGCLWCNDLISASGLQDEALTSVQREAQRYVEEATVEAPSVITLNAVATAHAVNDYLFTTTGMLGSSNAHEWLEWYPRDGLLEYVKPAKDPACGECSSTTPSRLATGESRRLPTR
jgi:hypothetical protein